MSRRLAVGSSRRDANHALHATTSAMISICMIA
jgi:hypothetical protein